VPCPRLRGHAPKPIDGAPIHGPFSRFAIDLNAMRQPGAMPKSSWACPARSAERACVRKKTALPDSHPRASADSRVG
jgi:hypothetical protein